MTTSELLIEPTEEKQVVITRDFDASRELVFRAWTEPQQLTQWFAPPGCTIEFYELDIREGGSFHSCIRTPDGYECWAKGEYHEIVELERIVFTMSTADAGGNIAEPASVGMDPEWPRATIVTIKFSEREGKTRITLHQTVAEPLAKRTGAYTGWLSMFDRLAESLPTF